MAVDSRFYCTSVCPGQPNARTDNQKYCCGYPYGQPYVILNSTRAISIFCCKNCGNNDSIIAVFLYINTASFHFFLNSQSILLTSTILPIYTLIISSNNRLYYRGQPPRFPVICQLYIFYHYAHWCLIECPYVKWFMVLILLVVLSLHSYNLLLHCITDYLSGQWTLEAQMVSVKTDSHNEQWLDQVTETKVACKRDNYNITPCLRSLVQGVIWSSTV